MTKGTTKITHSDGTIEYKIHLIADEGKALTEDFESYWHCVDVDSEEGWFEVDNPEPEPEE